MPTIIDFSTKKPNAQEQIKYDGSADYLTASTTMVKFHSGSTNLDTAIVMIHDIDNLIKALEYIKSQYSK